MTGISRNSWKLARVSGSLLAVLMSLPCLAAPIVTPHLRAELVTDVDAVRPGDAFWLALHFQIIPGWHTYWQNPGDSGEAPRVVWQLPPRFTVGPVQWPYPERLPVGPLMNYGYTDEAWMLVRVAVPEEHLPDEIELAADAKWLVCQEDCIPESGRLSITVPVAHESSPHSTHSLDRALGLLPREAAGIAMDSSEGRARLYLGDALGAEAPDDVWFFPAAYGTIEHAAPQTLERRSNGWVLTVTTGELWRRNAQEGLAGVLVARYLSPDGERTEGFSVRAYPHTDEPVMGIVVAVALAALGGFLLNVMPCVFPVLSMKALHLVRQTGQTAGHIRRDGWLFALGVITSLLAVAAFLMVARAAGAAIGWGFQLQSAPFVLFMAWLIFGLGLMLSGVWSFGSGFMQLGQRWTRRGRALDAFFTGVLAVVVATPCTAPFMGVALGYALTQPMAPGLAVFLSLGVGFAFPWWLLTQFPAAQRLLPRPGRWVAHVEQLLAFPMYGTVAWLAWVLAQQTGADGVGLALAGMVLIAWVAWLFQATRSGNQAWRRLGTAAALCGLLALAGGLNVLRSPESQSTTEGASRWQAYTRARLEALRAEGQPVFINFTAAWCITCQVNAKLVLDTEPVIDAMEAQGIVRLKADWTRRDPDITRLLEQHGRSGVPMYLLYPQGTGEARMLPSILTQSIVLHYLAMLDQ